ncbi:acyl-CoA dehydrogenase family protein [Oceanobacillus saliphilus]|uniref:acyl-CoA dehydrogenase family protein n=1 Tax=Oceanobacillus saliphilus TaxID=2925834 RepID=UPI00201D31BC|nr:acyl-CoA dehydrogenase family protein [Oceanobacillus saliphilus]
MDLKFSNDIEQFRTEVREWLENNIPSWWHDFTERKKDRERYRELMSSWDKKLSESGYTGISWPKEYGGKGEHVLKEMIFEEELGKIDAPKGHNYLARILLGPTMLTYATKEQKEYFIPRIIQSKDIWCQGFSEPNAGSDLASLSTRAVLDGDEWVINGQKTWTSEAKESNWCFLLARTDADAAKHKGITYFLVPMDAEGVTIRPITKITGENEFNEVFFDDVRIPKDYHVGNINEGWKVAMTTLSFERGVLALGRHSRFEKEFKRAIQSATDRASLSEDSFINKSYLSQKIAQSYIELRVMKYHSLKTISDYVNSNGKLGPEVSLQKLYWSEMRRRLGHLYMELQGKDSYYAKEDAEFGDYFTNVYYTALGENVYAGTSQIQRNILAEKVLGLPR